MDVNDVCFGLYVIAGETIWQVRAIVPGGVALYKPGYPPDCRAARLCDLSPIEDQRAAAQIHETRAAAAARREPNQRDGSIARR